GGGCSCAPCGGGARRACFDRAAGVAPAEQRRDRAHVARAGEDGSQVARALPRAPEGHDAGGRAEIGAPIREVWTIGALREALERATGWSLSHTEIRRILAVEEIRPHHIRLWLHSPDPLFRQKVRAICDVYLTRPAPGDTVLCIDEKTGMQALEHKHPFKQPTRCRAGRREFEYIRHGTRTLFAAFNPHTGEVIGECTQQRGADDLLAFMERVAKRHPTGKVTIVWDNLNTHHGSRWDEFNRRHGRRFRFVYTPLHASWVNQVEIWFGILARRVLKHASFKNADQLARTVMAFIDHWNEHEAHPFRWTFRGRFKRRAA
ncbi:MAG: IS630 family transposase, partial [Deltaproteobacteria bacterium]|nr:IS630 family transposase [Deltaproteobacteria bacterium]